MKNDRLIEYLLKRGRLRVDAETGHVFNRQGRRLGQNTENGPPRTDVTYRGKIRVLRIHRIVYIARDGGPELGTVIDPKTSLAK